MLDLYLFLIILVITIGLFIWGRWRYDAVAIISLLALTMVGIIPYASTYSGFSNPAVITVACVMIITQAITRSGLIDFAVTKIAPATQHVTLHIATLTLIAAFLSAFMNNVGALALMMPIAIKSAVDNKLSPSLILMPIAFGSVLGGLMTLIGTPPNLLIAIYRQQTFGTEFSFFSFAPVGGIVAVIGTLFIAFIGWRLLPSQRKTEKSADDLFDIQDYFTEVIVTKKSTVIGKTIAEFQNNTEASFKLICLIRDDKRRFAINKDDIIAENDIMMLETAHHDIARLISDYKLDIYIEKRAQSSDPEHKQQIMEAVVPPDSRAEGRNAQSLLLWRRYNINLLAISRSGVSWRDRLKMVTLKAGDVLMLQGDQDDLEDSIQRLGLFPLLERKIQVHKSGAMWLPLVIFLSAIGLTATQVVPVHIAFVLAILVLIVAGSLNIKRIYDSIDWPIIIMLGAMIPIGAAFETVGGTTLVASGLTNLTGQYSPVVTLTLLLIISMTLSDFMNNSATAVVMAPVAVGVATTLGLNPDTFLMAVAVGASCSFLTPIAHQNNTLVMGPGGYHFSDYVRLGFPLEVIVVITAVPALLWFWPLT